MSKLQNLLTQAAVIRDATEEHENTAVRVGTMFVDFIQACLDVLPSEVVDASGITASTSETNFVVRYRVVGDDGTTSTRSVTIPAASSENAGLLTPAQLAAVNAATTQLATLVSELANKANTADVNAALALKANTADVNAALALKADASDLEDTNDALSALATTVDGKANTADMTAALALKADASDLEDTNDALSALATTVDGKANTADMTAALAQKADKNGDSSEDFTADDLTAATVNLHSNSSDSLGDVEMKQIVDNTGMNVNVVLTAPTGDKMCIPVGDVKLVDDENFAAGEIVATRKDIATVNSRIASEVSTLETSIAARLFFNGNTLTGNEGSNLSLSQFVALTTGSTYAFIRKTGVVVTLTTADGQKSWQWKGTTWGDTDDWQDYGGSATVGNCYNVTNEIPVSGYYDLAHAIAATYAKGLAAVGMQITYASGANTWKTYQYVGADVTSANFTDEDNWVDMAGMSAGDEALINVNDLCGAPSVGYYTLNSARNAIVQLGATTGIEYRKSGLVLTYMCAENEWETKQFNGVVEDFGNDTLWQDFGGGGTAQVEVSDTPFADGEEAFSTGGAYTHLPKSVAALTEEEIEDIDDADTDTYNYYRLTNEAGDKIGEAFALPKGGSGSGETKVTAIAFQTSPLAAAAGSSDFVIRASIRSLLGSVSYGISTVKVMDNTTKQTLMTLQVDQQSSSAATDYSFTIDVSSFCKEAGTRYLRITATDDDISESTGVGTSFSRIITVKAVDVTVETHPNLHQSTIAVTDTAKVLTLYTFPNNQGSSIEAKVDIYLAGAWVNIATATVRDNSYHAVTFNATDIDGEGTALTHGSYLLRVQGHDTDADVYGNIVYTSLMVIDSESEYPVVALRLNDSSGSGTILQYESVTLDVAVWSPDGSATVALQKNGATISTLTAVTGRTYSVKTQITESGSEANPTALAFQAISGTVASGTVTVNVVGSAIAASLYAGALYAFDFASRSNTEPDHSITSNGYEIAVSGANWNSNGFISYLGATALRIAENVTAELNHAPFNDALLKTNGMGLLFAFAANHIADDSALLMRCYNASLGAGFYVSGSKIGMFCSGGTPSLVERGYEPGEIVTVGIVVEPSTSTTQQLSVTYQLMKLYINGEEAGCIGFNTSTDINQSANITFDGTYGDFYLYHMTAWGESAGLNWQQSFYNYLVKLTDTEAMIEEFDFEDVWSSVVANGPDRTDIAERGMPYIIESPFLSSNIESLDGTMSTKTAIYITLRYYDPDRPWRDFVAYGVQRRNQGTTSAKRPVKNARYYLAKKKGMPVSDSDKTLVSYDIVDGVSRIGTTYQGVHMELLNPDYESDDASVLADIAITKALIAKNKIRVGESTIPVDLITVKVDYSDSTNANDCGACNLMNAAYRMLGSDYMTPAQRHFDGTYEVNDDLTLTGLELNHSTANHPVAMYRSLSETLDNPYFYAKGNWKEDKNEQVALGFKDTPGYNLGCLNYGDFVEYYGASGETLNDTVTRFLADTDTDTDAIYLISQYCGSSYKFYRYVDGAWTDTTGSMKQESGVWTITGDVLNPVDGYELLTYQGFCWWQGVSSVAQMMDTSLQEKSSWVQKLIDDGKVTASEVPAWTRYFECMIDDDDLALAYAKGKKVPYWLYRLLKFCQSADYKTVSGWETIWSQNAYKYVNVKSLMAYYLFTDYLAAVDQQAKNMQPMFFLDDGGSVTGGTYADEKYVRMYPNKVYDADTLLGKDNDGGDTVDAEYDEMGEYDPTASQEDNDKNAYMGYGSVLWQDIVQQPEMTVDSDGTTVTLEDVAKAMRSGSTTVNGRTLAPFSPDGAMYFFMERIVNRWQKMVSSFDGEKKYITSAIDPDSGSSSPYFYALHGLRLTALPSFISKRFAFRDAHYHTGSFTTGVIGGRIGGADNATIAITAAKTGFFAIGNDSGGSTSATADLAAGESATFNVGTQNAGKLLYVYQAHRLKSLDLSALTLDSGWGFGSCELLETLKLGYAGKTASSIGSYAPLTNPVIGELPFLKTVDIRCTDIVTLDLGSCPRVEQVLAADTSLTSLTLAQTAPIASLTLPATMAALVFINLPNLTYPATSSGGLTLDGATAIQRLRVDGCPNIDAAALLKAVLAAQSGATALTALRIANQTVGGDGTELAALVALGTVGGMDDTGATVSAPVIDATYQLKKLYESYEIAAWEAAITGLTVVTVVEAYITLINEVNGDDEYTGSAEVETVTLENVDELALTYYNGEEYDDYLEEYAEANADINDIVTS